jgi:putative protein-disulfide isomerase
MPQGLAPRAPDHHVHSEHYGFRMQLIFIGDPMCSWCYGFGKELSELLIEEADLSLQIVVGGVRAGSTEVLDEAGKRFRLSHWARVEAASGLPFNRAAFMARQRFVYDTAPICRSVVTARIIAPAAPLLDVFRALQRAFYVDGLDTTDAHVLARTTADSLTALGYTTSTTTVLEYFLAKETIAQTGEDFAKAKLWGVHSFPALLLQRNGKLHSVAPGYMSAADMRFALRSVGED